MRPLLVLLSVGLLNINGCKNNPVDSKQENRNPVIRSLTVFPNVVKPSDSLIVICDAMDPDGDTLVYDWYSLSGDIVKIKGAHIPGVLYNTHPNSQIFYAPDSVYVSAPRDTFGIECAARDGKGGQDVQRILFVVTKGF